MAEEVQNPRPDAELPVVSPDVLALQQRLDELETAFSRFVYQSSKLHVLEVNGPVSQDPAQNYQPYNVAPAFTQFVLPFTLNGSMELKRIFVPLRNGSGGNAVLSFAVAVYRLTNPTDVADALVRTGVPRVPLQFRKVVEFAPKIGNLFIFAGAADTYLADTNREARLSPGTYGLVYHSDTTALAFEGSPDLEANYRAPLTLSQAAAFMGDFPESVDTGGNVQYNTVGPYALLRSRLGVHVRPITPDLIVE